MLRGPSAGVLSAFGALLVVSLLLLPTTQATSIVSYAPPYIGFSAIRNISNVSAGPWSSGCGVWGATPVAGKFNLSTGDATVKLWRDVTACGGTAASSNYSGQLGLSSPRFTVASSGFHIFNCAWSVIFDASLNVVAPASNNGSVVAKGSISLFCELVDHTTGTTAPASRTVWSANLLNGTTHIGSTRFWHNVSRSGVHLTAGDRYSLVSYLQFYVDAEVQASVPSGHGYGAYVSLWMAYQQGATHDFEGNVYSLTVS